MTFRRSAVAAMLALVAGWAAAPAPTVAQTPAEALSWSVSPADGQYGTDRANFDYTLQAGDRLDDGLTVTNLGSAAVHLQVYAADAFTTSSGQLDLLAAGVPSTDAGTWVEVGVDELTLEPGATSTVPFSVTVPDGATPGDHAAGIVTSFVEAEAGSTVRVDRRLGSRILVRVPGELTAQVRVDGVTVMVDPSWVPFAPVRVRVRFVVVNEGSTRLTGTERVDLTGLVGGGVPGGLVADLPELLPGDEVTREVEIPGVWALGRLTATVQVGLTGVGLGSEGVTDDAGEAVTSAWPVGTLAALALVVVLAGLLGWRRSARRPRVGGQ